MTIKGELTVSSLDEDAEGDECVEDHPEDLQAVGFHVSQEHVPAEGIDSLRVLYGLSPHRHPGVTDIATGLGPVQVRTGNTS